MHVSSSTPCIHRQELRLNASGMGTGQYESALKVVKVLQQACFHAYFAGGWVRDTVAGLINDDIDIVTDAPTSAIQKLFSKTSDEGLAYGIVFVTEGNEKFEVATFRKDGEYKDGRTPSAVESATMEEDAFRRDFTVNSLYYDPLSGEVFDFTDGLSDIAAKVIRAIGDPCVRFHEDRLRMVRAVRFSAKLQFAMDPLTERAIAQQASTLFPAVSKQKVWKELEKMYHAPHFDRGLLKMYETGLLQTIFPDLKTADVQQGIEAKKKLPKGTPLIIALTCLFPGASRKEMLDLCSYLKLSNVDGVKILNDYYAVMDLVNRKEDATAFEWVVVGAHHEAERYIPMLVDDSAMYLERLEKLRPHIERMKIGVPVVTSKYLQAKGLNPSKLKTQFRDLLREAERISVNHNLTDPEAVFVLLQNSAVWPTSI